MEEAWTVDRAVEGLTPSGLKLTRSLQQDINPKTALSFGSRPKFGDPVYHNNIVGTLKIHLLLSQVLRLVFIHVLAGCTTALDITRCMNTTAHNPSLRNKSLSGRNKVAHVELLQSLCRDLL